MINIRDIHLIEPRITPLIDNGNIHLIELGIPLLIDNSGESRQRFLSINKLESIILNLNF